MKYLLIYAESTFKLRYSATKSLTTLLTLAMAARSKCFLLSSMVCGERVRDDVQCPPQAQLHEGRVVIHDGVQLLALLGEELLLPLVPDQPVL